MITGRELDTDRVHTEILDRVGGRGAANGERVGAAIGAAGEPVVEGAR